MKRQVNLSAGIMGGLGVGVALSLIAFVIYVFRGSVPFTANGVTVGLAVLVYLAGGVFGGGLVGALWPMTSKPFGAAAVGVIGLLPMSFAFGVVLHGMPWTWEGPVLFGVTAASITLGGALGFVWFRS